MYDVVYLDSKGSRQMVAASLDRDAAAELARCEARRRHAGRMFLAGSEPPCRGGLVLIVDAAGSVPHAA
jgi:hypothetical protein